MLSGADILEIQDYVRQVLVAEEVVRYAVRLTDSSRPGRGAKLDFIEKWVKWGAGLRASHALVIGAKARALLHGRHHVSVKDIQALAKPILRHRVLPNFYAEAEGITVGSHRRSAARRGPGCRPAGCKPRWHGRRRDYLDPAIIARLGTIDLKARTIVEGFLTGLHRSPYKGFSVEFAEYRQYLPGDDLATLDWKVFARSDKHFVKKYEEETNLTCHLLIDVSASMGYALGRSHQAAIRVVSDRRARLPDAPAARFVRPDRVRRQHFRAAAGERAVGPPAHGAAGARAAGDRRAHQRRQAAARSGGRRAQARHGGADLGSARRSGDGARRTEAFPLSRHRRDRVSHPRSVRVEVSVRAGGALPRHGNGGGSDGGAGLGARGLHRARCRI